MIPTLTEHQKAEAVAVVDRVADVTAGCDPIARAVALASLLGASCAECGFNVETALQLVSRMMSRGGPS